MADENRIQLKGDYRYEEDKAGAALTPGHLIELYESSSARRVRVHSTEGGWAERAFAVESPLQGQTATSVESRTIDTAYALNEVVSYHLPVKGAVVRAWLKAGEDIAIGDKLISAGDGTLIENGSEDSLTTVREVLAVAEETLDLSGSGAVATRLNVRLL